MQKLNPRVVWLFFIGFVLRFAFLILLLSFVLINILIDNGELPKDIFEGPFFILILLFLFFVVFSYIWAKLSYRFYRYELRGDGFRKEYGVIWKKYVSIPYERIQNVDIYRGPVARLLGLSDLHIQTAGMSYTGQKGRITEGRLPGLSREDAEKVKDELIRRAKGKTNQGL